ncbi:MAG TPA: hypothetical protein VHL59_16775, partial [Thermoanaerobaculia bacterium]|nr:hypothetical protein [Thermoanaerobaculia bacterium]
MKSTRLSLVLIGAVTLLHVAAANAGGIDMNDPHRALGREDDVRVDAQLVGDTISAGTPIGITYQIQNFTAEAVAVAAKVSDASYDPETRTITVSLGSEVPLDGALPQMVTIAPGEKKTFRTAATPTISVTALRAAFAAIPRFVQLKVTILRNLTPFAALIANQSRTQTPQPLSDELFDQWFESSDTIFLNALPVRWNAGAPAMHDVESRGMPGGTRRATPGRG